MTTKAILPAALAVIVLTGCGQGIPASRGQARIDLFKQCMEMAAKIERKGDDDVSDIVSSCSHQAYEMTFHIK